MNFKCKCSMTESVLGDGCDICNTDLAIDLLDSQADVYRELQNMDFSVSASDYISTDLYEPLVHIISILNLKITQLSNESTK